MADPNPGDKLGPYRLIEKLGEGGNAWVWKATDGQRDVAVKVLKSRKVQSEPYERFRREVETVQGLGDHPGVLPIRAAHLPEHLGQGERAWFAMPLAERLDDVLASANLRDIVEASAAVSTTLADLFDEHGLVHRDVKPDNLYRYEGRWVVGDFGLVRWPDSEALTLSGKVVGPRYYVAYEMMETPDSAAPGPADVYSLAKSLWVLAMNARFPLPGHQQPTPQTSIGSIRPHAHAHLLDELIERATQIDPLGRPSMRGVADDLHAWLSMDEPGDAQAELADLVAELRAAAAPSLALDNAAKRQEDAVLRIFNRIQEALQPLDETIQASLPRVSVTGSDSRVYQYLHESPGMGEPGVRIEHACGTTAEEPTEVLPLRFRYGVLVALRDDGQVVVRSLLYVGNDEESGALVAELGPWQAPVESLEAEAIVTTVAHELQSRVPDWARQFVSRIS